MQKRVCDMKLRKSLTDYFDSIWIQWPLAITMFLLVGVTLIICFPLLLGMAVVALYQTIKDERSRRI
jgi:hypothetical protein